MIDIMTEDKKQDPEEAVEYVRYSSSNQRESSIEAQSSAIRRYAERNNIIIVETFADRAKTGRNSRRPGFKELIESAKNNPTWKKILVYSFSRFFRNEAEAHAYYNMLRDLGIKVVSVTEDFEDTPDGNYARSVAFAGDSRVSAKISADTFNAMKDRAEKGYNCGGIPPLGYNFNEFGMLEINQYEANIVKEIFKMYELNYSYQKMADVLNGKGYRTKNGSKFKKTSFNSILSQEKYNSVFSWNKVASKDSREMRNSHKHKPLDEQVIKPGFVPRIIDEALFERVQLKMKERAEERANTSRTHYMLSGIKKLRCKNCGKFLVGEVKYSHGNRYTVYSCPGHKDKVNRCPTMPVMTADLDEAVAKFIIHDLRKRTDLKQISKHMDVNQDHKALKNRIAGLDKEIKNLLATIKRGCTAEEVYKELNAISAQKRECEREEAKYAARATSITPDNKKELCDKLSEYLKNSEDFEVKYFLKEILYCIDVDNDAVTITLNIA